MIIQAIPGSGKTTLARTGRFSDTDSKIEELGYKGRFDQLLKDPAACDKFFSFCREADEKGTLLTNLDLSKFRMHVDKRFCYRSDDYLHHLALTDRTDLLAKFEPRTLRRWALDYEKLDNVVWMDKEKFLSDYVS